jgi:hypothetical protein
MDSMDIFYSGVVWALCIVVWVVWTDTRVRKAVIITYVIKMLDCHIAM